MTPVEEVVEEPLKHTYTSTLCILTSVVEVKSVYVKNVPSTATASDIEEVFKKFGNIRQDKMALQSEPER
ncbi:putative Ras GTPase-activating protein-binding protein [Helianthus anomalus]